MSNIPDPTSLERSESPSGASIPNPPDTPLPDPDPHGPTPRFALRSDGRLLLGLDAFAGRDLRGRETWTGLVLPPEDESFVFACGENAAHEAASKIIGKFPAITEA